mgnify:FL=1
MDSLSITIISIIVVSFFSAFIKGRKKDRCLVKIDDFFIHIYNAKEKTIWGRVEVESNALIIDFQQPDQKRTKNFILYKNEFKNMQLVLRLHSYFDQSQKKRRDKVLNKALKPGIYTRLKRKMSNVFATAKDAVAEIVGALIASAKNMGPMKVVASDAKHVERLKGDSQSSLSGNSYEPIWERFIGENVVVVAYEDKEVVMTGVLVEYSQNYICLFDASIEGIEEEGPHDLLVSRTYGTIRHVVSV